jgi:iron complex transport system substrate-binding protein
VPEQSFSGTFKGCAETVRKIITIILIGSFIFSSLGCAGTADKSSDNSRQDARIEFKDDSGKMIKMDKPATKIISLYSAHTENLFALGLDKEIIGVGTSDAYPPAVTSKPKFDYRADPEKVIAANPDLVLIRPHIQKSAPDFVSALEKANINVVTLYPETFDAFGSYINKLALLTGREEKAHELLKNFAEELNSINQTNSTISSKVRVFFESTETQYRTITNGSMPDRAIKLAGGINVAADAQPVSKGSSIAAYGDERILKKADSIDVYVAQAGTMNAGGNPHSIAIRPGFSSIKAVKENRVYNIDEKLISSPTFRFVKGVRELSRMFYPEIYDDFSVFDNDKMVSRKEMAEISVKYKHKTIFTSTSKYYQKKHQGHVYGDFKDVPPGHPYFDYIETAVLSGYMEGNGINFNPDTPVTREELAKILFMLADLKNKQVEITIRDVNSCENANIVETVVQNGLMQLSNSSFRPGDPVKGHEVTTALKKLEGISRNAADD